EGEMMAFSREWDRAVDGSPNRLDAMIWGITSLARANGLATQGKLQSEIARTLGVSVMTLHRWRKARPEPAGPQPVHEAGQPNRALRGNDRIAELQLENPRLRRLVTDLLLEKIKLEETVLFSA